MSVCTAVHGPILLQKSPQKFCETRISNNRIEAGKFVNQCCASTPDLESILRAQIGKIFLQHNRPNAEVSRCPLSRRCLGHSGHQTRPWAGRAPPLRSGGGLKEQPKIRKMAPPQARVTRSTPRAVDTRAKPARINNVCAHMFDE